MRNKIIFVSALAIGLSAASLAFASGATVVQPEQIYFNGFYAGLGAGIEHATSDFDHSAIYTENYATDDVVPRVLTDTFETPENFSLKDNVFAANAFVGFGQVLNSNWYLGAEVFGRYADAEERGGQTVIFRPGEPAANESTYTTEARLKSDFSAGADLRFGYLFTPKTLVYVLGGAEYSEFDASVFQDIGSPHNQGQFPINYSQDKHEIAFMPGVGIETMLTDKLSLRGQYTYADYSSFTAGYGPVKVLIGHASDQTPLYKTYSASSKFDPARGVFTLDLAYHWNGV